RGLAPTPPASPQNRSSLAPESRQRSSVGFPCIKTDQKTGSPSAATTASTLPHWRVASTDRDARRPRRPGTSRYSAVVPDSSSVRSRHRRWQMRYKNIDEILAWTGRFHTELAQHYQQLARQHDRQRLEMLLSYLAEHQRRLAETLAQIREDSEPG